MKEGPDDYYDKDTLEPLPYFDRNATINTNLTVQMGTDVFLSCRVNRLGNKTVSVQVSPSNVILTFHTFSQIISFRGVYYIRVSAIYTHSGRPKT